MNTHHEEANREKVLRLMAEKYPTKEIVYEKIVYLRSQLMLPKGTEHFMSDLHGAYDSFFHILNNCSGVIKEKVDYCFGERMTEEDKAEFCTLIYYPREKVEQLAAEGKNTAIWYQQNLANLLELTKLMSWKFPASKVYSYIPKRYESVIVELMNTRPEQDEAQLFYYKQLIETIVEIGGGTDYIEAFSVLIKRLAVERIHIVGDFFDRGDRPDGILDLLMEHPSVDIQWGNHDVLWMGAALGSEVCIAGVIRNSLRYRNTDVLERGYGISLRPLSTFASRIYPDENPIKAAERAITMMMFKLEGALIRRNPDFRMEDRLLLDKIDFRSSYVTLGNGRRVELESAYFPTIDDGTDCYELTEEERHIIEDLRSYFLESKVLQRHVDYLYQRGSMYTRYNGNLLFHACVLLDEEGEFRTVTYKGKEYRGRAWMDFCEEKAREAWNARTQEGLDFMYFLWCGLLAPTSGRSFTTFERSFIADESTWEEPSDPYFRLIKDERICEKILEEFDLDPKRGHIINGHVPVKVKKGESPLRAGGRALVIDGGFAAAFRAKTGISGYTLIYNSRGLRLLQHQQIASVRDALKENQDIESVSQTVELQSRQTIVRDTDRGAVIAAEIADLHELLRAYQSGHIKPE
ncbi:firmicute fructose-1,6-bisphosphatase [Selenomonas sp. oral taxon 137 str. F0430]|uniref:fructose-bisphosphatase class III n=1 Tax=Selenomonas sp. oral taxon 137 TaxID=712531 RepID=UPI0001EB27E3|nr:fructose-bisphosphatase class III [Selenomonas sp. oral taxon 137]EFR41473.1 firmicute fructose-1,6-bisphosphatase [Selenomonas sp. oral taxon 137 str. F0430]